MTRVVDYQELKSKPRIRAEDSGRHETLEDVTLRMIVGKDELTGMVVAHKVETKGPRSRLDHKADPSEHQRIRARRHHREDGW